MVGHIYDLKVLEHRCALFSAAAVGRQPRELTIETIFVPPGEDGEMKRPTYSSAVKLSQGGSDLHPKNSVASLVYGLATQSGLTVLLLRVTLRR